MSRLDRWRHLESLFHTALARDQAERTIEELLAQDVTELKLLQEHVHDAVGTFIRERTGRRPMILPVVLEV